MSSDSTNDWAPVAPLETLKLRATLFGRVRSFFARRGMLEVETPILSSSGSTDPHLHSFSVRSQAPASDTALRYLHTSPEFAMKRLLAAGSGSIYQICKVFRAGEAGRLHNAEFTMIEWYVIGRGYHELMMDVADLLAEALDGFRHVASPERLTYAEAFRRYLDLDPHQASATELADAARARGISVAGLAPEDADGWRDLLLTHVIEPQLGRGRATLLYDYPASAAALARIRPGSPAVAERFEVYLEGLELANGYHELSDPREQCRRFEHDRGTRCAHGLADIPQDERLLAALTSGLPDCSGVALGFDRLVMLATGARTIADVLAFPSDRA